MPSAVDDLKKAVLKFDTAAKKRKDVGEFVALAKKLSDLEKLAKAWDKAFKDEDAEAVRNVTADMLNAIKVQIAKWAAVIMKLKKADNEDAMELGQDFAAALQSLGAIVTHYRDTLLSDKKHGDTAAKLPTTHFSGDWVSAKKDFEAKAGAKKPSKKFLGVIRESSGLEKATKILDAASKANDAAAYRKGLVAFKAAATKYAQTIVVQTKVAVSENDRDVAPESVENPFDYNEAAKDLIRTLNQIRHEAEQVIA